MDKKFPFDMQPEGS